jgi:hypothetical protein
MNVKSGQHINRYNYTIIEVLASMGIFIILITALMQFFGSARTLWISSSRRNELYANARVALDLISNDLHNAMYQNDSTDQKGLYPFWFRQRVAQGITNPQVNELNFISETDLKPLAATSKICEIRYTFVSFDPASSTFEPLPKLKDSSNNLIPEGWLVRSCVGNIDSRYNFEDHSLNKSDSGRMLDIWSDLEDRYTPVIPGVVQLDITCYSDVENDFAPMVDSTFNTEISYTDNIGFTKKYPKGQVGTMFPQVVTVRIKLMDQDSWKKYMKFRQRWVELNSAGKVNAADGIEKEIKILLKKVLRTFSRTVYLSRRNSM